MIKFLNFIIILLISNSLLSQNSDSTYVLLDNHNFYRITKTEHFTKIEVPKYIHIDDWKQENSKRTNKKGDTIMKVESLQNKKYYTFYSVKKPVKKSSLDKIYSFSVIDVSKESKLVWKEYPYEMIFIEKIDNNNYMLWYVRPQFDE